MNERIRRGTHEPLRYPCRVPCSSESLPHTRGDSAMSVQRGGSKYGTIKPRIEQWEIELQTPHVTNHVRERWSERTEDACSPREAWVKGVDVSFLRSCPDLYADDRGPADRLTYYCDESNEVVLVARNGVVTTVLLVSGVYDDALRRTLHALRRFVE